MPQDHRALHDLILTLGNDFEDLAGRLRPDGVFRDQQGLVGRRADDLCPAELARAQCAITVLKPSACAKGSSRAVEAVVDKIQEPGPG